MRLRRRVLAQVNGWHLGAEEVHDLDHVLVLAGYRVDILATRTQGAAPVPSRELFTVPSAVDANRYLHRLVELARTDELAGRIVVQRLLPGLLAIVRRRSVRGCDGLLEELLGAVWMSIRTMRLQPRSEHVAASLVYDATYRAFTAPRRRRSASEIVIDPRLLDDSPASATVSPCEELAEVIAAARCDGMTDGDAELVRQLLTLGSTTAVAAERKVTPRTVRNHRDRVTYQLRRAAATAA